jgi:hypothetical protein
MGIKKPAGMEWPPKELMGNPLADIQAWIEKHHPDKAEETWQLTAWAKEQIDLLWKTDERRENFLRKKELDRREYDLREREKAAATTATFVFKASFCELWEGMKRLASVRACKTTAVARDLFDNMRHKNRWASWTDLQKKHCFTRGNPDEFFKTTRLGQQLWALCERKQDTKNASSDWQVRLHPKHRFDAE